MSAAAHANTWPTHFAPLVQAIPWTKERSSARESQGGCAITGGVAGWAVMQRRGEQKQDHSERRPERRPRTTRVSRGRVTLGLPAGSDQSPNRLCRRAAFVLRVPRPTTRATSEESAMTAGTSGQVCEPASATVLAEPTTGERGRRGGRCRFCGTSLRQTFVDLGMSPLCESYVSAERLDAMEPFYPLHVYVCSQCFLVQLGEYVSRE